MARRSIARRLSRYVLLISTILLFVVMSLLGILTRGIIERVSLQVAEKELDLAISDIEKVIVEVERAVDNIDWVVESKHDSERFLYMVTRELVSANPNIIGSAVAFEPGLFRGRNYFAPYSYIDSESGELLSIQMGSEMYDYPSLDWYSVPKRLDRACWSEPYYDEGGGNQRMATYSCPLRDTLNRRFFGVLTSDISLEWLSSRVADISPFKGSYALMVSAKGTYIAHPDVSRVLSKTIFDTAVNMSDTTAIAVAQNMVAGNRGTARIEGGDLGILDAFAVYGPLSNGWSIMLVNSYASVFRWLYVFNFFLGVMLVLGLAGLYFGCRNVIRRQMMPIVEFSNAAMNIAKGNFKATIPEVRTKDELLQLRNSLDYMQRSINSYITELKTTTASNERYESELNIAREIQMSMLPQNFPERTDCDLYAMVQPAREVGGDLYDFIEVGDRLFFLVGDVSGKGVPAALFMTIARSAFRFIGALGLPMDQVVHRVNNSLCDGNDSEMFVTLFAGCLDLTTGVLDYCNAGHNPIVVVGPDGSASFLRAKPNLAAGLFMDFKYEAERLQLERGSRLILYTDGVTEAERPDKAQFGEKALLNWAKKLNPDASANASTLDLYAKVRQFARGAEQNDDITIMSIVLK